ncbi:MAG: hypothetical protein ACTSX0_03895 [Promethearchaeota archaeon]
MYEIYINDVRVGTTNGSYFLPNDLREYNISVVDMDADSDRLFQINLGNIRQL